MSQFYTKEQIDAQGVYMATALSEVLQEVADNMPPPQKSKFMGTYLSEENIPAVEVGVFEPEAGSYVYIDAGSEDPTELYLWDADTETFVKSNINPDIVAGPPIEEAADISSFTTAFDTALNPS